MKNLFFRILTIILLVVCGLLLIKTSQESNHLTSSLFLSLAFLILLGAVHFSTQTVLAFGCFGLLVALVYSLSLSEFALKPILLLLATVAVCYIYSLKATKAAQKICADVDNRQETNNVLKMELNHLRQETVYLKQKLYRHTTLKDLTENISASVSLEALSQVLTAETLRIIGKAQACLFYLVDKEKQELKLVSSQLKSSRHGVRLKKGDAFDNWVFKHRVPLLVENAKKDFRFNLSDFPFELQNVHSLIAVPLIRENKLVGILRLDSASTKTYEADDLRLLNIVADLAAVAVENAVLYQKMQQLATTDGLSGLFVHRYFHERFDQEVQRALWTNARFALLMIDIDDFKRYNDQYGHIAGDIVLKQIAQIISLNVNSTDIVGRYGGEEFAVLFLDTTAGEAKKRAEKIRASVEQKEFILRRQKTKVGISGGLAFFPENAKVKEQLIQKADQALYQAKREGKNKICTV